MTVRDLADRVRARGVIPIVSELLNTSMVAACVTPGAYQQFQRSVKDLYTHSSRCFIAGSGNWGFSLNPKKLGAPFHAGSDIDVGVIDETSFASTWEQIRDYQRRFYYKVDLQNRERLKRNGENVYSGFASPEWIPDYRHEYRLRHVREREHLSTSLVGYKKVKLLFFRNEDEAVDYYSRGIYRILT